MLGNFHRRAAYLVLALIFASGLAHFVLHQFFPRAGEFGPLPNPAEPWLLRLHGAAAMATLVLLGSLLPLHVARFWGTRQNSAAAMAFLGIAALLIASGYGLYYLGGDDWRAACRIAHIAVGIAALPAFALHLRRGRQLKRRVVRNYLAD
ncbi:MAG: hypothetical protein ISP90_14565 [Nevskia sp.]|nr:hypothetical protein [Nevskia sp.]